MAYKKLLVTILLIAALRRFLHGRELLEPSYKLLSKWLADCWLTEVSQNIPFNHHNMISRWHSMMHNKVKARKSMVPLLLSHVSS
jgi:hypothetical protein